MQKAERSPLERTNIFFRFLWKYRAASAVFGVKIYTFYKINYDVPGYNASIMPLLLLCTKVLRGQVYTCDKLKGDT